jgi:uncharacterized protein
MSAAADSPEPTGDHVASELYGEGSRALQSFFDTERLANRLQSLTVHEELSDDDISLVNDQSTVWIATVDAEGWPDVSYKGGARGFVHVVGRRELRVPSYDGNGMFRTLGNAADTGRVALLFVDLERPWRMRVHGTAVVSTSAADLAPHPGAQAVLIVTATRIFPNCSRYIHRDGKISPYVPDGINEPRAAEWKQLDVFADVLPKV